ncbi:hypothetical protein AQJ46_42385 [Streptomyces canus]|uniref:Uncharacterized protein n=1 Tax=Streptomyces canus TaxID=58343 RepID=A0A101RNT0_9ACTN|nr:hypothetical protein AQJ46_42385 [Streptomyces canus]
MDRDRDGPGAGRPIGDFDGQLVVDDLEVHPALDTGAARDRLGVLPAYIERKFDASLRSVVDAAASGRSGIAVLVGGSSTGKTRALWEAVRPLTVKGAWRLWHPIYPTRPDAVLAELDDVAPHTVVWLNEAQNYLGADSGGEQVAAGLRNLLNDPARAPVLVLATLWSPHWDALTTRGAHAQAAELLDGHKIDVPEAFTSADLAAVAHAADTDPRLAEAAECARDGQITQYLAGVPFLMDRYRAAPPATRALVHAAMDARRLGAGPHIPLAWLAEAAPSYLSDTEWAQTHDDWLQTALAYGTAPAKGIPGIFVPVKTRASRGQRTRAAPRPAAGQSIQAAHEPRYQLADYLDQHGRRVRADQIPPVDFWTAAAVHAHGGNLTALGYAAWTRGLYRDAAQLYKRATAQGDAQAAIRLVEALHALHPRDDQAANWAAAHIALHQPSDAARLLGALRAAGAHQVAAALARRAVADCTLDNPVAVSRLLKELREAGAEDETVVLLGRDPASHVAVDYPYNVHWLVEEFLMAAAHEQIDALAERAIAQCSFRPPIGVIKLMDALLRAGADEQALALAKRAASHMALYDSSAVRRLLRELQDAGAHEQAAVLANRADAYAALQPSAASSSEAGVNEPPSARTEPDLRDPAQLAMQLMSFRGAGEKEHALASAEQHVPLADLGNPRAVARLLGVLLTAGMEDQVAVLLDRDPAVHVTLDEPVGVADLLEELRKAEARQQAAALAKRAAAHTADTALADPWVAARLLKALERAGAHQQAAVLAERAAAHASLEAMWAVALLQRELLKTGARKQSAALVERLTAAGRFEVFIASGDRRERYRFGREPDGTPAPRWTWEDLE